MGLDKRRGKDFEAAREALASWRRAYGGRGRPIPPALWSKAADVARGVGVPEVARALRLSAGKLARLVEGRAERAPGSEVEAADFVELGRLEETLKLVAQPVRQRHLASIGPANLPRSCGFSAYRDGVAVRRLCLPALGAGWYRAAGRRLDHLRSPGTPRVGSQLGACGDKTVTLPPEELLRRFLLHVLPKGYVKIRQLGLMASSRATTTL